MVRASGPQPEPRSRKVPVGGGVGACFSSTEVPLSMPSGEKIPPAVDTTTVRPASTTSRSRSSAGEAGSAVK